VSINYFYTTLSASPPVIGSVTDTADRIVTCYLPKTLPYGTNNRISVVSSNEAVTGIANANAITIRPAPYLGNDTAVFVVCAQDTYNITNVYNTTGLSSIWSTPNPAQAAKGLYQLEVTNSYGCKDTAAIRVKQDVAIWIGMLSSDWHNPANWSNGRVPNDTTHVLIPAGAANPCIISVANAQAASVQVQQAGSYQTASGRVLTISGKCSPLPTTPE
jgi:hypothetical protein